MRHILCDDVLNVTDTLAGSFEVVLQTAIPTFLNIAVWIVVVIVLALIVIVAIRLVGWATYSVQSSGFFTIFTRVFN